MKIEIKSSSVKNGNHYYEYTYRRVEFSMSKYDSVLSTVKIVLADLNGSTGGGDDKQCKVIALLPGYQEVVITEKQSDMIKAIDRAMHRVTYTIQQRLKRRHRLSQRGCPSRSGSL